MPKTNRPIDISECCKECFNPNPFFPYMGECSNPNCKCHGGEKTMAEKINFICKKVGIVGAPDDGGEKIIGVDFGHQPPAEDWEEKMYDKYEKFFTRLGAWGEFCRDMKEVEKEAEARGKKNLNIPYLAEGLIAQARQEGYEEGRKKEKEINQMMFQVPIGGGEIKVIECGKCKSARQSAFAEIERFVEERIKSATDLIRGSLSYQRINEVTGYRMGMDDTLSFIKENKTK